MKVILKIVIYLGLLIAAVSLVLYLFFPDIFTSLYKFIEKDKNRIKEHQSIEEIQIGYSFLPESFDPVSASPIEKTYILNIYEGLVKFNRNLSIEPALAISWGRIKDNLWEFKLRENVVFHNGSELSVNDVVYSFERAMKSERSVLKDNLNSIQEVSINNGNILIETKFPDPLLLQRITGVLIFPENTTDFENPIGTGPYTFNSFDKMDFVIERFESYWGKLPAIKKAVYKYIPDTFDRIDAIREGDIHILANVPPSFANEIDNYDMTMIKSLPSLEVNFILMNTENDDLTDPRLREALSLAFDKQAFVDNAYGFAKVSHQFVSNGIFGFNPEIEKSEYNLETCQDLVKKCSPFEKITLILYMKRGLERVGTFLSEALSESGISLSINYVDLDEFTAAIKEKKGDLYYFGWRSELGDAQDFYEHVVLSNGDLNTGYKNLKADTLIEQLTKNFDQEERLKQLQNVMKIITEDDIIGVPLFETDVIYAIRENVDFQPRLDGFILINEIK